MHKDGIDIGLYTGRDKKGRPDSPLHLKRDLVSGFLWL
jgi:hypothetical protein